MKDVLVAALEFLEAITRLAEAGILFWLAYSELRRRRREAEEREREDREVERGDHVERRTDSEDPPKPPED